MPIDYKQYPPNWKQIRARILERAGNRCEQCKVPNNELICRGRAGDVPVYQNDDGEVFHADTGEKLGDTYVGDFDGKVTWCRVILTIAHLDHDKENHDVSDDRLRAWCQRCHLNYDRPRHIAKRKANRHKGQINIFNP